MKPIRIETQSIAKAKSITVNDLITRRAFSVIAVFFLAMGHRAHADSKICSSLFRSVDISAPRIGVNEAYLNHLREGFQYTGAMKGEKEAFQRAFTASTPEARVYAQLGYKWEGGQLRGPDKVEFYKNVQKEYERQGVPEAERLMPGWIYQRTDSQGNKDTIIRRFDEPVENFSEFTKQDFYSPHPRVVPANLFKLALSKGVLPVVNSHDVGHLIAFLTHPRYRKAMVKAFAYHAKAPPSRVRSARLYSLFEFFTLPDPARRQDISRLLAYKGFSEAPSKLSDVQQFFRQLPREALDRHIEKLLSNYDQYFLNYGGALANIPERMYWVRGEWIIGLIRRDYHGDPGPYIKGQAPAESVHHMNKHLEIFLTYRGTEATDETKLHFGDENFSAEKLDVFIRDHVARMEYALWEGTKLDPVSVVNDMVMRSPEVNVPYLEYIRTVRGEHSRTYRSYLQETHSTQRTEGAN